MNKYLRFLLLTMVFIVGSIFLDWLGDDPSSYVRDIIPGYRGKVVNTYYKKTTHFVIELRKNDTIDIALLSKELEERITIGDSIIKIKNTNCCFLKKPEGDLILLEYKAIPKDIYEDDRWPNEFSPNCLLDDDSITHRNALQITSGTTEID